jgi:nuclear pore complex protein Nup155
VPVEYSGEEQAICCVGLATPKPNVFLSAIQHVLVLATPVEVGVLGAVARDSAQHNTG